MPSFRATTRAFCRAHGAALRCRERVAGIHSDSPSAARLADAARSGGRGLPSLGAGDINPYNVAGQGHKASTGG